MSDYRKLSKNELIEHINQLPSSAGLSENQHIRDLQAHQIELEMQNRELREAQQQLEGSLQQTRSELDALFNAIPAIVFFKDLELRYVRVNPFFADFIGLPAKEVLGKADTDLFPQEMAERFQLSDRMALDAGKTLIGEEQCVYDAQGQPHWLSTAKAPYFGQGGNIAGVVGVSKNVTATRVVEQRSGELLRENRRLTRRLFTLQEKERLHLARELHDELGQWLTAIQAEAQAIRGMPGVEEKPGLLPSVQSIADSAAQIHEVIRRILRRLRPTLLEQLGLMDSLRDLVAQWRKHYPGIAFELLMDGPLDSLNEVLNITVYRIVQEALTNIASHADASRVSINVHCAQDAILLAVEDNGKGMDTRQPRSGMGLLGIRERTLAAEGEFALNSAPGQGLRIDIEIPLSRLEEESEEFKHKD